MASSEYEIGRATFERIRDSYPALSMSLDLQPENVDLELDIRAQPGLLFSVNLNLQNIDELHLSAGSLWISMFPCTKPEVTRQYYEAVAGLLDGRYRVLEHCRGKRVALAELQRPVGSGWETIGSTGIMIFPWLRKEIRVLQTSPPPETARQGPRGSRASG